MSGYTEDELDGLTDEERAALLEADAEGDDTTTTLEDSLKGDTDGEKEGDEGEEGAGDADQGDAEGEADNEGQDAGGAGADGDDASGADGEDAANNATVADAIKPAPLLVADAPADAEARLAAIATAKNDLMAKVDDGEITIKEYQAELDKLSKEERSIERAVDKAQLAAEMRQQQEVNNWMQQVQDFTSKSHPEYSTSKVRWMALDTFVKEIGTDPANSHLNGAQILAEAHKRVVEDLGEAPTKGKAPAAEGKQAPLKGSKAEAPKTLANVPAAQMNEMENSKWASLNRLRDTDPLAYEEKLMGMTEAQRDEYLAHG